MDKVFSFKYIALAIIVAIVIRAVLVFFKALGINNGEIDDLKENRDSDHYL